MPIDSRDKESFFADYKNTRLFGDIMPTKAKPKLLVLHGAGNSNRERYAYLRNLLANKGISSAAFDFVGHGDTGGELIGSSLADRTAQAEVVINKLNLPEINILASSMSGYTAVKLTEYFVVRTLVLFVPCAYDKEVYSLKFGPEFSDVIKKPGSWKNSDAWEILKNFQGKLLIVSCGKDEVVPNEIPQKLIESARNAVKKEQIKLSNAPHAINSYLQNHPEDLQMVIDKIVEYIL